MATKIFCNSNNVKKSVVEVAKELAYALVGGDAGGYERESQLVLDESHGVQQALYSGGIAVDKQQAEQLGEAVVDE